MPQKSADAPSIEVNKRSGRAPGGRRPRTEDDGFLGPEGDEPTVSSGLLDGIETFLDDVHKDIQKAVNTPSQEITTPTERPGRRNPNDDERPPLRPGPGPAEEEEIIPGNPDDLGARGKRRNSKDDINASPILRRGLLGV